MIRRRPPKSWNRRSGRLALLSAVIVHVLVLPAAFADEPKPDTPAGAVNEEKKPDEPSAPPASSSDTEDRVSELEDRLDQVEKKTILDRINWHAEYRTVLNSFFYEGPSPDPYDRDPQRPNALRQVEETSAEVWSHRLRLGATAEPIRALRLTARLTMFKNFGDNDAPPFIQDSSSTRIPRDSGIRLDQAWLDWFVTDWLAFSAGRIAYGEGSPAELKDNAEVRRATWGTHMVDGEYDTVNVTFNLARVLDGLYIRVFYASWFFDNDGDVFGTSGILDSGTDNLRIIGGNVELAIPGLGKNFFQLGYYNVPKFRPQVVPIQNPMFDPSTDITHAPAPLNGSLLFPSAMPDSMGSYQNLSALLVLYDIASSGLDLFASGSVGFLDPNGQGISYELPNPTTGAIESTPFLFLASEGESSGLTYFVYAGARVVLPIDPLNRPKLGVEVNHGSRYHLSFATPTDQLLTKLAVRGTSVETYLLFPLEKHLFLRLTHLYIDSAYSTGFFGPNPALFGSTAPELDQRIHNLNVTLNASF